MSEPGRFPPPDHRLPPNPWQIRDQVDRLAAHPTFSRSPASLKLLRFLGDSIVTTGGKPVSQRVVADALLGLSEGFRPTENPLVRMQVVRLRKKLHDYYSGDGANDPVVVSLPRGRYSLEASWSEPARLPVDPTQAAGGSLPDGETTAFLEGDVRAAIEMEGEPPPGVSLGSPPACRHSWPVVLIAELADGGLGEDLQSLPLAAATVLVPKLLGSGQFWAIGPLSRQRALLEGVEPEAFCDRYHADYVLDGQLALEANAVAVTLRLLQRSSDEAVWATWCREDLTALPVNGSGGHSPGGSAAVCTPGSLPGARVDAVAEILAGRIAVVVREVFQRQAPRA